MHTLQEYLQNIEGFSFANQEQCVRSYTDSSSQIPRHRNPYSQYVRHWLSKEESPFPSKRNMVDRIRSLQETALHRKHQIDPQGHSTCQAIKELKNLQRTGQQALISQRRMSYSWRKPFLKCTRATLVVLEKNML